MGAVRPSRSALRGALVLCGSEGAAAHAVCRRGWCYSLSCLARRQGRPWRHAVRRGRRYATCRAVHGGLRLRVGCCCSGARVLHVPVG